MLYDDDGQWLTDWPQRFAVKLWNPYTREEEVGEVNVVSQILFVVD